MHRRHIMPLLVTPLLAAVLLGGRFTPIARSDDTTAPPAPTMQDELQREPPAITAGEDIGQPPQQVALQRVGEQMRTVQQRFGQRDVSSATRQAQDQIVTDLASLIDQLTEENQTAASASQPAEQKSPAGPGDSDSRTAASDSAGDTQNAPAPDEPVDMAAMRTVMQRLWGHLPPRAREQMMQNSVERFLPKYEVEIERYFQRLAEESTGE